MCRSCISVDMVHFDRITNLVSTSHNVHSTLKLRYGGEMDKAPDTSTTMHAEVVDFGNLQQYQHQQLTPIFQQDGYLRDPCRLLLPRQLRDTAHCCISCATQLLWQCTLLVCSNTLSKACVHISTTVRAEEMQLPAHYHCIAPEQSAHELL